jgi:hypothetical protein
MNVTTMFPPEPRIWLPDGIEVVDPRPIRAESPDTFWLPSAVELAQIGAGNTLKFIFTEPEEGVGGERMWVEVHRVLEGMVIGELANWPSGISMRPGDLVRLPLCYATDYDNSPPNSGYVRRHWDPDYVPS